MDPGRHGSAWHSAISVWHVDFCSFRTKIPPKTFLETALHLERHFGARRVGHKTGPRSCNVTSLTLHQGFVGTSDFLQEPNPARMIKGLEKSTCWLWELQVGKQPEAEGEELRMGVQGERRRG